MARGTTQTLAFVVGADTGIAYQLARELGRDFGYTVFLGSPSLDQGRQAARNLRHQGLSVSAVKIDLECDESITEAMKPLKDIKIDVLVINTGGTLCLTLGDGLAAQRLALQDSFNTHTISAALLIESCAPFLNRADNPRVVLFSSIFGSITARRGLCTSVPVDTTRVLPECLSYAALNMVAAAYASKYSNWKINAVCPGYDVVEKILGCDKVLEPDRSRQNRSDALAQLVKMSTLGPGGETGTFTNRDGKLPW